MAPLSASTSTTVAVSIAVGLTMWATVRATAASRSRGRVAALAGAARAGVGRAGGTRPGEARASARAAESMVRRWVRRWRATRSATVDGRLVAQLDEVAAALRAGASLGEAITGRSSPTWDLAAGSVDGEADGDGRAALPGVAAWPIGGPRPNTVVDVIRADLHRGASLTEVCRRSCAGATGRSDRLVASAFALASAGGGQQARAVDAAADAVRELLSLDAEIVAQAAQAKLSGLVLVVTPLAFTVWSASTDAGVRGFLLGDPVGVACLATGLLLDVVGGWWMARLCRSVAQ